MSALFLPIDDAPFRPVSAHRRQAALSEIQRLKTEGAMRQQGILRPASRGSLSVSSVTLPVKTSFVREVAAGAGKGRPGYVGGG